MLGRRLAGVWAAGLVFAVAEAPAIAQGMVERPVIDPETAIDMLATGGLRGVRVNGDLELPRLVPKLPAEGDGPEIVFDDVVLEGDLIGPAPVPLTATDSRFGNVIGPRTSWPAQLTFRRATFAGLLDFRESRLGAGLICENCTFEDDLIFERSVIDGRVEVDGSTFDERSTANFSRARFLDPVTFQYADFPERTLFHNSIFEQDASFVGSRADAIIFSGAQFHGDAEFRACRFGAARFGVYHPDGTSRPVDPITVFYGFADFRRCTFDSAVFDDALFRGQVSFRRAQIDAGGLSLRSIVADSEPVDLRTAAISGPLMLSDAIIPNLKVRWHEIQHPLLDAESRSEADAETYRWIAERLKGDGAAIDALRAEYRAKELDWSSAAAARGDRLAAGLEWYLWTWPTVNGTSLERLVLLAGGLWVLGALPLIRSGRRQVVIPRQSGESRSLGSAWQPQTAVELPAGSYCAIGPVRRGLVALEFAFALIFKVSTRGIRYVTHPQGPLPHRFTVFAFALWIAGAGLLGVGALTLANLSPPLRALLPGG